MKDLSSGERRRILTDLLARFEAPDATYGELIMPEEGEPIWPYYEYSDLIRSFIRGAVEAGLYDTAINWSAWIRTEEWQRLHHDPAAVATATREQLARLTTTYIHAERFTEGVLAGAFTDGVLAAIIRRAIELERDKE